MNNQIFQPPWQTASLRFPLGLQKQIRNNLFGPYRIDKDVQKQEVQIENKEFELMTCSEQNNVQIKKPNLGALDGQENSILLVNRFAHSAFVSKWKNCMELI